MNNVTDWFASNKLLLNTEKTYNITFQYPRRPLPAQTIKINLGEIYSTEHIQFLGIRINQNLDWSNHIEELNKKLCISVYAISVIRRELGQNAALNVYFVYFQGIVQYGIEFWSSSTQIDTVLLMQK